MLKHLAKLEFVIENKVYQFLCDQDAPIPHVKEALFKFLQFAGQIEDAAKMQAETKEDPAPSQEQAEELNEQCTSC